MISNITIIYADRHLGASAWPWNQAIQKDHPISATDQERDHYYLYLVTPCACSRGKVVGLYVYPASTQKSPDLRM